MTIEFSEDKEYWINAEVASYFNKDAIFSSETAEKIIIE